MRYVTKSFAVEQLPREVAELVEAAQRQRVVLTRNGAPYALIVGIENKDAEDLELEASPEFWRMIEERRREPTVPLEQVLAEIEAEEKLGAGTDGEARPNRDLAEGQ
jgi:antitoxin (DNA-binding transcriptional repressor) of toxin-antitoxin stability system